MSSSKMAAYMYSPAIERLQAAQGKPLIHRCQLLTDILNTTSTKELKSALPVILQEIFDFDKGYNQGWQLDRIFRSYSSDLFDHIRRFLSPEGPLMKLINCLQADPYAVYEFPLKCIPAPARQMIEDGTVPAFYANKLQGQSFSTAVIMLNAFELYMFHLAYALVSPTWQARNTAWSDLYEFIYPTVIDDLLVYFLPCDKSCLPSVPHFNSAHLSRSPMGHTSPSRSGYHGSSPSSYSSTPVSGSGLGINVLGSGHNHSLFKSSFITAQKQHQQSMPVFDQAENEIWRSETFLQVITEFWLNQNSFSGSEVYPLSGGGLQMSARSYSRDLFRSFGEHFMPNMNQVKMVRLLVKYLHHFANSASSIITSPFQQSVQSPLDQFKRLVIPHILQKKLYTFLRHAFDRWPLDSCFRMVLETWLSYIQPWRYTDVNTRSQLEAQHSDTDLSKNVDERWDNFVEDNLLFYTVLTNEFIPRIYRMDLTSPYSAYMVYRVSRILSLPNLVNLILKAEQEIFGGGFSGNDTLGESYLSGSSHTQMNILNLPSQMVDMEGPGFQYISFYSDLMRLNMQKVVSQLSDALETVQSHQQQQLSSSTHPDKNKGFFASIFGSHSDSQDGPNNFSSPEYRRMPVHLEQAIHNFCSVFSLNKPSTVCEEKSLHTGNLSSGDDSRFLTEPESLYPECVKTATGLKLTDLGRLQLINKERKFDEFYVGDPDLQPVRSYENATLVRLLFHLCSFLNSHFRTELIDFYYQPTFLGRLSRVYLTPPSSLQLQQRKVRSPVSENVAQRERSKQPRLTLRFLASYRNLVTISLLYIMAWGLLGTGPVGFVVLVFTAVLLWGVFVATVRGIKGDVIEEMDS